MKAKQGVSVSEDLCKVIVRLALISGCSWMKRFPRGSATCSSSRESLQAVTFTCAVRDFYSPLHTCVPFCGSRAELCSENPARLGKQAAGGAWLVFVRSPGSPRRPLSCLCFEMGDTRTARVRNTSQNLLCASCVTTNATSRSRISSMFEDVVANPYQERRFCRGDTQVLFSEKSSACTSM